MEALGNLSSTQLFIILLINIIFGVVGKYFHSRQSNKHRESIETIRADHQRAIETLKAQQAEADAQVKQSLANTDLLQSMFKGFTGSIGELAQAVNKSANQEVATHNAILQSNEYLQRLNASITENTSIMESLVIGQNEREKRFIDAIAGMKTGFDNIHSTMVSHGDAITSLSSTLDQNTSVISTMQSTISDSVRAMEGNIVAKLDDIARHIGQLGSESKANNDQHKRIINELNEVKKAVLSLVPPDPKPPKVSPMPKPRDDKNNEELSA